MSLIADTISVSAGDLTIVNAASLRLAAGECVALVGPNGAGKSTLLRAIAGVSRRDTGDISVNGASIAAMSRKAFARTVAYLPQTRHVEWDLTARDVVSLGRHPHQTRFGMATDSCEQSIDRALADVEAEALAERRFAVLSGGEKARILLARSLAVGANFLLADEPIAGLDPYHQLHVMEILRARAQAGAGILVVLHDLSLAARFADRVIVMSMGEIAHEGVPGDTFTDACLHEVYAITALRGEHDKAPWLLPWKREQ